MSFVKNLKVLLSLSFFEKDLDTMFNNALKGKIGFLDKTHVILTQWELSIFRVKNYKQNSKNYTTLWNKIMV